MYEGNVSCMRAMFHVRGQCFMYKGNVSCMSAMFHV